jgi:hypothetical protein
MPPKSMRKIALTFYQFRQEREGHFGIAFFLSILLLALLLQCAGGMTWYSYSLQVSLNFKPYSSRNKLIFAISGRRQK